jgi:hypothetical protein
MILTGSCRTSRQARSKCSLARDSPVRVGALILRKGSRGNSQDTAFEEVWLD